MNWLIGHEYRLADGQGRDLGVLRAETVEYDALCGTFTPGADYPAVEPLFREFEEAADSQVLSVADKIGSRIDALNIRLESPDGSYRMPVHDVQIWSDGGISCRALGTTDPTVNGAATATTKVAHG